jgi:hypothetical protein
MTSFAPSSNYKLPFSWTKKKYSEPQIQPLIIFQINTWPLISLAHLLRPYFFLLNLLIQVVSLFKKNIKYHKS